MAETLHRTVFAMPCKNFDALEISGGAWRKVPDWKSFTTVDYPAFDICKDIVPDRTFDIIFAEQVFEHVRYPYRAATNVYKMLNEGGMFVISTPFLIQVHGIPSDYTRWTEDGMRYFLEDCGFEASKTKTWSWGNRDCAITDFNSCAEGKGWTRFDPEKHSLVNERNYPVVVWAIATKGAETQKSLAGP